MMIPLKSFAITGSVLLAMTGASAAAMAEENTIYSLNLTTGVFPSGVSTENANGQLPDKSGYKHGFTENGWTVGRLDNRGYVAVSPTYTDREKPCENILTLPQIAVTGKSVITWASRSVYRHFPESYRLEAIVEGEEAKTLFTSGEESFFWKNNTVLLDAFQGKNITLRFVCTSSEGYMLALSDVLVREGESESNTEGSSTSSGNRKLIVDRGTGTWCVNCPSADVAVESLVEKYGDRIIALNTHVNDVLANELYWKTLDWYSIPRLMLNRIKATEGSDTKKFADYIDKATPFSIAITALERQGDEINCAAKVRVNEDMEGTYSVGYVLTGDFHDSQKAAYSQQNNCTQPYYGAFYYLPSVIPPALMYYDDVTLTFDGAFAETDGSTTLPLSSTLIPGEEYDVEWSIPVPELASTANALKVVAYVVDSTTGEIMNADVATLGKPISVSTLPADNGARRLYMNSEGEACISLPEGTQFSLEIFSMHGVRVYFEEGYANGQDNLRPSLSSGLYIIRLSTSDGEERLKAMIR